MKCFSKSLVSLILCFAVLLCMLTVNGAEAPKTVNGMDIYSLEVAEGTVTANVKPSNVYYVSPAGSDLNDGSEAHPFKTLYYVKDVLTRFCNSVSGDITVYLADGYYRLFKPLEFTQAQLKKNDGGAIRFCALPDSKPVISGGTLLENWQRVTVNGQSDIYKTSITDTDEVRQLYVNGVSMPKASTGSIAWSWADDRSGIYVNCGRLNNADDMEMKFSTNWKVFICPIKSYSSGKLIPEEPFWSDFTDMITEMVNGGQSDEFYPKNSNQSELYLYNDLSFIDTPGEWYFDRGNKELYYYPASAEEINEAEIFIPHTADMLQLNGGLYDKINNVSFEGITFAHGAWNEPSAEGLVINQAQNKMVITRNGNGSISVSYAQTPACVTVRNAQNVRFNDCSFTNMGATALSLLTGVRNSTVIGCDFTQCADGGIVISNNDASYTDYFTICSGNTVSNCLLREIGTEYWSMPAITVFYAEKTLLTHNEIYNVPYSGISLGWGWYWTPNSTTSRQNEVSYNRIGHFMQKCRDGGGIYTLGQQPDSTVKYNYIYDQGGAFGGLYHDEGSAYFTTQYNVIDNINESDANVNWIHINGNDGGPDGDKTTYQINISDNYYTNWKTSHWGAATCVLSNNHLMSTTEWEDEALEIRAGSGLQKEYRRLLSLAQRVTIDAYNNDQMRVLWFGTGVSWMAESGKNLYYPSATVSNDSYCTGNIGTGTVLEIMNVDFKENIPAVISLRGNTGEESGFVAEIRLDSPTGELLAEIGRDTPTSGGWSSGVEEVLATAFMRVPVTGVHRICIVYKSGSMNFYGITFEKAAQHRGDLDLNGRVDSFDLCALRKILLDKSFSYVVSDHNLDGTVDIRDLVSLKRHIANAS